MATHADISGNLTMAALQSVRRNAANTTFEAYTPMYSSMGSIDSVASVHYAGHNSDITSTSLSGTDVPGLYLVTMRSYTDKADAGAGTVSVGIAFTDALARSYGDNIDLSTLGEVGLSFVLPMCVETGSITYSATITGSYGAASYTIAISAIRLIAFGRLTGTSSGIATVTGTATGA